jgi:hypothetical protein
MKYIAICFTDKKFEKTRERYANELKAKNIFDNVIEYSPENFEEDFILKHNEFMCHSAKGYGYYIWKPYVILKTLQSMNDNDVLVYGDAGNEITGSREECLDIFDKVFSITQGVRILACKQGWNIRWIKADLYLTMGWKTFGYAFKPMAEAARIVFQKNEDTMKFVNEWLHYSTADYHNIDDSISKIPNLPFFIEHRYDQSVFSILFQKYKGTMIDFGDIWTASRLRF